MIMGKQKKAKKTATNKLDKAPVASRYHTMRECKAVMQVGGSTVYGGPLRELASIPSLGLVVSLTGNVPKISPLVSGNAEAWSLLADLLTPEAAVPVLAVDWPDGEARGLSRDWWSTLLDHIHSLPAGDNVAIGCVGGHGRTGTALAVLASLGGIVQLQDDPVQWVRDVYEEDAVETWAQIAYVEQITGHTVHAIPSWETLGGWAAEQRHEHDTPGNYGSISQNGYGLAR